jgi:hypothetical protein
VPSHSFHQNEISSELDRLGVADDAGGHVFLPVFVSVLSSSCLRGAVSDCVFLRGCSPKSSTEKMKMEWMEGDNMIAMFEAAISSLLDAPSGTAAAPRAHSPAL